MTPKVGVAYILQHNRKWPVSCQCPVIVALGTHDYPPCPDQTTTWPREPQKWAWPKCEACTLAMLCPVIMGVDYCHDLAPKILQNVTQPKINFSQKYAETMSFHVDLLIYVLLCPNKCQICQCSSEIPKHQKTWQHLVRKPRKLWFLFSVYHQSHISPLKCVLWSFVFGMWRPSNQFKYLTLVFLTDSVTSYVTFPVSISLWGLPPLWMSVLNTNEATFLWTHN